MIFLYSSDGHRFTFDEDVANQEALRISTMKPDSSFKSGESRLFFEYPYLFPPETNTRPLCMSGILCSASNIGHSLTESIFVFLNHNFKILQNVNIFENDDFNDSTYVYWRNNLNPDFVFLELAYGPIFSSLSVGTFFLISRIFNLNLKTSVILSFFYAFSTLTWAYSQTSLNSVSMTFFLLLGVLFFIKFIKNDKKLDLVLSSSSLSFAFLIRPDTILAIIPLFGFLLLTLKNRNTKIQKLTSFTIPLIFVYVINRLLYEIRFDVKTSILSGLPADYPTAIHTGILGLLFSPGVGLFIFAPILLTVFVSFPDFYKKEKKFCFLFVVIVISFLIFYGRLQDWHGLVSWGPRYLLPIIPFLLIPLGFTLEKRKNNILKIIIVLLVVTGVFFNLVYIIQDVQWFIWGTMGQEKGLYTLGRMSNGNVYPLWINPVVLYTFEYSQLTHSIIWSLANLHTDIFLLELLGYQIYTISFVSMVCVPIYLLLKQIKSKPR